MKARAGADTPASAAGPRYAAAMACADLRIPRVPALVLVGLALVPACFNPSGGDADTEADGTATTGPSTGAPTTNGTTPTTTATPTTTSEPTDTTLDPATTSTSDTTTQGSIDSSTGEPSNCPGGDPTPGAAPYVVTDVAAGQESADVDVGDINGDGHLDFVHLSRNAGSVEVFFGDGAGGLVSNGVDVLNANGYPDTVRLGAIADETVDLFVHMEGPVELWVVRGDGAGNWPSPQVYTGTYVRAIDLADLNGDDVLDLAYVGASNLEVRLGNPTETYADPMLYGQNYGSAVRAADITGDGSLDILTADYGSTELQVYAGGGNGTFTPQPTIVTGSPVSGIDVGYLDADDHVDLVLTTTDDLRVFYGEDDGTISSTPGTILPDALTRVRVADIDADGVQDLITRDGANVEIRFSAGDQSFSEAMSFACSSDIFNLEVGDFNEDCVPDLIATMGSTQSLCLLLSDRG